MSTLWNPVVKPGFNVVQARFVLMVKPVSMPRNPVHAISMPIVDLVPFATERHFAPAVVI